VSPFLVGALVVTAALMAIGLYRVWAGPTVFDRLVAVALITANGVVVLVLLGLAFERPSFFLDLTLAYAMLAFLLPITLGRYFEDRDDGPAKDPARIRRRQPPREHVPQGYLAERARAASAAAAEQFDGVTAERDDDRTDSGESPGEPGTGGGR